MWGSPPCRSDYQKVIEPDELVAVTVGQPDGSYDPPICCDTASVNCEVSALTVVDWLKLTIPDGLVADNVVWKPLLWIVNVLV